MDFLISNVFIILGITILYIFPLVFLASLLFLLFNLVKNRILKNKYRYKQWIYMIAVLFTIFLPIFYIVLFFLFFKDTCNTKYSNKIYSQDRVYYAQVIEQNCGATTAYDTSVAITDTRSLLSDFDPLNVQIGFRSYIFDFDDTRASIKIVWLDKRKLKINYNNDTRIRGYYKSWKDIIILYN